MKIYIVVENAYNSVLKVFKTREAAREWIKKDALKEAKMWLKGSPDMQQRLPKCCKDCQSAYKIITKELTS